MIPGDDYRDFLSYMAGSLRIPRDRMDELKQTDRLSIYDKCEEMGVSGEDLARCMADYMDLEYLPVIDPESIKPDVFPAAYSRAKLILAVRSGKEDLIFVLSNPLDMQLVDSIELISGKHDKLRLAVTQPSSILSHLKEEEREAKVELVKSDRREEDDDEELMGDEERRKGILTIDHEPSRDDINRSPIKYIADRIMYTAVTEKASDIHIEPKADKTIVRFRIDGDMTDKFSLKPKTGRILLSRFKVMADMDIAERRKPQDGGLEAIISGRHYKMRLATTSTNYGESLVIRILDMESDPMDLAELGMTPEQAEIMYDVSQQHTGAIIVVGTTGSGKSTTLYSLISSIDIRNKSLMTIEDPVEYELKYANQQEVNEKAGVTFEALLKSAVRQDPDIVYLGEIRDPFTAKTVMDLASTGHLTFGTLHSANTTTAISRLERLGVNRGDIVDSVLLIESQRLIKRLCPKCRKVRPISDEEIEMMSLFTDDVPKELADPVGCPECRGGYVGRQGIYELLRFNPQVIDILKGRDSVSVMRKKLHEAGQYLMSDHALDLLRSFTVAYRDVYHIIFLEEKRLTGGSMEGSGAEPSPADVSGGSREYTAAAADSQEESAVSRESFTMPDNRPFEKPEDISRADQLTSETHSSRILVVDDDPDLREFVTFILSKNGYSVVSTGDGVDAIVTLSSQEFDLIISDVDMPNLDGFKLLEVINNKGIKTPVVFLTGRDDQEDEIRGYELGAEDYIRKPIHKKTLLLRIGKLLK